jgi:hypothetical protein
MARSSSAPRRLAAASRLTHGGLVALAISALGAGAASAATVRSVVEAENMTTSGKIRSDSQASGGRYVLLASNGKLSSSITLDAAASSVDITAKGAQCHGAPAATLSIDGTTVQTVSVTGTAWASYTMTTAISPGRHSVTVGYANDVSARRCDRSLAVDKLSFFGDSPPSPAYAVRHMWLNIDTASAFDFPRDSSKIDTFVAHYFDSWAQGDSYHTYNRGGAAYFYADFGVAGDSCCVASVLDTPTVDANGWWATHNGRRIPNPWGGSSWLVDLGKPGVAAAYVSSLKSKWGTHNWQGVFADDVNSWRNLGYTIDGYSSATDWINRAVIPLVRTVTDAIRADKAGVVVPNIGNWPQEPDMDAVADVAGGAFDEWYLTWANGQPQSVGEIENEYHSMRRAIAEGHGYLGLVHSTTLTRYAFCAAAIMGERDKVYISNQTAYGSDPQTWDATFELDLGAATEPPRHVTGSTAWSRHFTNHVLSIDTSSQTCAIQ